MMKNKLSIALSLALVMAMLVTSLALADTTHSDGDGLVPYSDNNMVIEVCPGSTISKTAAVYVN